MKKQTFIILLVTTTFLLFAACGNKTNSAQTVNDSILDISSYQNEVSDTVCISSEKWTISLYYDGHIKSSFDYPLELDRGSWGRDSVTVRSTILSETIKQVDVIKTYNNVPDYNGDNLSVYTLDSNGIFTYDDRALISNSDATHSIYQDSYTCNLSKEKALEFKQRILQILSLESKIETSRFYEPYHSNAEGVMITEYSPINIICDNGSYIECSEKQYEELLSVFEELRQLTDKYNWEKVKDTFVEQTTFPEGAIQIPNLP